MNFLPPHILAQKPTGLLPSFFLIKNKKEPRKKLLAYIIYILYFLFAQKVKQKEHHESQHSLRLRTGCPAWLSSLKFVPFVDACPGYNVNTKGVDITSVCKRRGNLLLIFLLEQKETKIQESSDLQRTSQTAPRFAGLARCAE